MLAIQVQECLEANNNDLMTVLQIALETQSHVSQAPTARKTSKHSVFTHRFTEYIKEAAYGRFTEYIKEAEYRKIYRIY